MKRNDSLNRLSAFLIPCLSIFIFSDLLAQEWKDIFQFSPPQTLNKVKFLNDQIGFTAGSLYNGSKENIHYTRDGGRTWKNANSGYTSMRFMDIFIQDESTIFMSGNEGLVIRSTDGGVTWETMNTGTKEQLWGIHFTSRKVGFAVGSNGIIITTNNGGQDWEIINTGISNLFYDVFFTSNGIGFASGSNVLFKTDDGGGSWLPVDDFPFQSPADWIRSIKMVNENIGFACADIGRIYKTTDGGNRWERLNSGVEDPLFDIDFVDENNGFICGFNGVILKTTDGGLTWTKKLSPLGVENLYSLDMITKDLGYICTHTGHILKLSPLSGNEEFGFPNNDHQLFPNPCSESVKVILANMERPEIQFVELCDLLGRKTNLQPNWINNTEFTVDIPKGQMGLNTVIITPKTKSIISLPLIIQTNRN